MSRLVIIDPPNIKKYNQDLGEKRIKWVEDKMQVPLWKKSLGQAYDHNFITARNLHLSLFPIERYRSTIFSSAFIDYYNTNNKPVDDCYFYKLCESYKELISNNGLNPILQKKGKQRLQFEVNLFKANGHQSFIYPAMLKYLDFTLDDIIKTRSEILSLRDTVQLLLEYDWFKEFVDVISKDGSNIYNGEIYNYYLTKKLEIKNQKLSYIQLESLVKIYEILNEEHFDYARFIASEHFKFFKNICYTLVMSDYSVHNNASKTQLKLVISNFTKLYKLIYKEEMQEFQKKVNIKKTLERRGRSTRSNDSYMKIQELKKQGKSKSQISKETGYSLPTIRKYWESK